MSLFHSYLNPLYGFELLTDLVFDIFHTVPLNVVKDVLQAVVYFDVTKFKFSIPKLIKCKTLSS